MNAERFASLAEAWGGAIARWPAAEQDSAFTFLATTPERADAILAEAREIDALLDCAARSRAWRWLTGAGVGAGLVAATAAGLVAGVNLSLSAATPSEDEALLATLFDTGLGDELGGAS